MLALVFVVTAIAVPYYVQSLQAPEPAQLSLMDKAELARGGPPATWMDSGEFFWGVILVGLYLAHLAMASASVDFMSTPFTHLFSPLVFSMVTYYRLYHLEKDVSLTTPIVNGTPLEIVVWVLGVLVITYLVARIRMARLMLNFRDIDWALSTPTVFDSSYGQMLLQVRPLIYPPRVYRACEKGILIEGWFYAMAVPFDSIHAVDAVQGAAFTSQGYCLATSMRNMLRIQVSEKTEPILISPRDRNTFLHYCQQHIAAKVPVHRPGETKNALVVDDLKPRTRAFRPITRT